MRTAEIVANVATTLSSVLDVRFIWDFEPAHLNEELSVMTTTVAPTRRTPATGRPPQGGNYQNVLLAILFATFGFVFFDRLALNFLAPYWMPELGVDNSVLGLLGGIPALTWAISGLLLGYLSERIDRRKPLIVLSVIGFSVCSAFSGLVGGLASLILLRAVMGMFEGGVLPLSQTLMMFSSTERRRGFNMGLIEGSAAGLLGGIVGPIVTVWMAEMWGWRTAFLFTIIPGAILTLLILVFVKELRLGRRGETGHAEISPPTSAIPLDQRPQTFAEAVRNRNIILSMLIAVFFITWFITTQTFTPTYLAQERPDWSTSQIAFALTGIGVGWVVWGVVVPTLSDRIGRKLTIVVFALIASAAPIIIMNATTPWMFFVGVAVSYTGMGCFTLYMATIPAETVSPKIMASCLGLIMGVGEIGGGFIAPWIGGIIADRHGLNTTFWMCTAAAIIVALLALGLRETSPAVARRRGLHVSGESA